VTAARPKLDIDTTRERLLALGCVRAADQILAEAVRTGVPAHNFLDRPLAPGCATPRPFWFRDRRRREDASAAGLGIRTVEQGFSVPGAMRPRQPWDRPQRRPVLIEVGK
jgi:hypothetical protein